MPKLFGDTLFTLQFTEIKMYSPSIYLKHKKDTQICIFKQQPQKLHGQDIIIINV